MVPWMPLLSRQKLSKCVSLLKLVQSFKSPCNRFPVRSSPHTLPETSTFTPNQCLDDLSLVQCEELSHRTPIVHSYKSTSAIRSLMILYVHSFLGTTSRIKSFDLTSSNAEETL